MGRTPHLPPIPWHFQKDNMTRRRRTAPKTQSMIKEVTKGPADVTGYLSTGSTLVDLIISGTKDPEGKGGIPQGKVTGIFGPASSGKSLLAGELCGSAQRQKFDQIHLIDTEDSFEFSRANIFGLDVDHKNFHYHAANELKSIEDLIGIYTEKRKRKPKIGFINRVAREAEPDEKILIVVDTIEVLPSDMQLQGKDKRGQSRAKSISGGMRLTFGDVAYTKMAVVFINQVREKPSDSYEFGHRRVVKFEQTGGVAAKHYPHLLVYLEEKGPVEEDDDSVSGVKIWSYVYKSKIDKPLRSCNFTLDFDYGIDDIRDCVEWLRENTEVLGSGKKWYKMPGDKKKFKKKENFIKFIEDEGFEFGLINLVRTQWKEMYSVPERKPRRRV
jgi:RecA/RadA recombinase